MVVITQRAALHDHASVLVRPVIQAVCCIFVLVDQEAVSAIGAFIGGAVRTAAGPADPDPFFRKGFLQYLQSVGVPLVAAVERAVLIPVFLRAASVFVPDHLIGDLQTGIEMLLQRYFSETVQFAVGDTMAAFIPAVRGHLFILMIGDDLFGEHGAFFVIGVALVTGAAALPVPAVDGPRHELLIPVFLGPDVKTVRIIVINGGAVILRILYRIVGQSAVVLGIRLFRIADLVAFVIPLPRALERAPALNGIVLKFDAEGLDPGRVPVLVKGHIVEGVVFLAVAGPVRVAGIDQDLGPLLVIPGFRGIVGASIFIQIGISGVSVEAGRFVIFADLPVEQFTLGGEPFIQQIAAFFVHADKGASAVRLQPGVLAFPVLFVIGEDLLGVAFFVPQV